MARQLLRSVKQRASEIQHPAARLLLRPVKAAYRLARSVKYCCDGTWDNRAQTLVALEQRQAAMGQRQAAMEEQHQNQHQDQQRELAGLIESLRNRLESRQVQQEAQEARVAHVGSILALLEEKVADAIGDLERLRQSQSNFVDLMDYWKSRQELPADTYDELQNWKNANTVPENPRVTVCVATYNRAELLTTRCLPSILNQTYSNLEVIVVGDCCTDDTEESVQALGDSRIRFVNLKERGQYPTEPYRRWMVAGTTPANHALSLASGDFVTHLDDDDEYVLDRIERLVDFAKEKNADFVWHPFWYESAPDEWELNHAQGLRFGEVTTSSMFYRSWFRQIPWDLQAHLLMEPGDWNRIRKIKCLGAKAERFPEPLLRHYKERSQNNETDAEKTNSRAA